MDESSKHEMETEITITPRNKNNTDVINFLLPITDDVLRDHDTSLNELPFFNKLMLEHHQVTTFTMLQAFTVLLGMYYFLNLAPVIF